MQRFNQSKLSLRKMGWFFDEEINLKIKESEENNYDYSKWS